MLALADEARREGWTVGTSGGGHIVFQSPTGEKVWASSTPSDRRAIQKTRSLLRQRGFQAARREARA
jgi:hypothetical protein